MEAKKADMMKNVGNMAKCADNAKMKDVMKMMSDVMNSSAGASQGAACAGEGPGHQDRCW